MPNLTNVTLTKYAFDYKNDVTIRGSTGFIPLSELVIGDFYQFFNIQTPEMYEYCMNVLRGSGETTDLVIGGGACPFANVTVLDLGVYPRLKSLRIGNNGFDYVEEVKLIGLNELESVEIGSSSFSKTETGQFHLMNCPKMKSLKIGKYSFSDYTVIEIENCGLEVIEMGGFKYASLELKSILIHSE